MPPGALPLRGVRVAQSDWKGIIRRGLPRMEHGEQQHQIKLQKIIEKWGINFSTYYMDTENAWKILKNGIIYNWNLQVFINS